MVDIGIEAVSRFSVMSAQQYTWYYNFILKNGFNVKNTITGINTVTPEAVSSKQRFS